MSGESALTEAYASCERAAREHYENFPVASLLVPASWRRHIAAVYAFARAADDFADEGVRSDEERHALLDRWGRRLCAAAVDALPTEPIEPDEPANTHEIFRALGATIRERSLPLHLFEDLLSAFRQDVTGHGYERWPDLLDYCRRSANPVGRLVLRIAGYADARLDAWSDAICTALQLANFWQDVRVDAERGRVYVPADVLRSHGVTTRDHQARTVASYDALPAPWRAAVEEVVGRTSAMFDEGRPLCSAVRGRLRYELRATWLGGVRILDRLAAVHYDPIEHRPSIGASDVPWFVWRLLTWR